MSMCARVLFGIGGCLGLMSSVFLIIAIASPSFSFLQIGNSNASQQQFYAGLTTYGSGCANQRCKDYNKRRYEKEADYEKACKAKEKNSEKKDNGKSCTPVYNEFMCWCTYGDKDVVMKTFKDGNKEICNPKRDLYKDMSGCDKFEYDGPEEVFDAMWSARTVTMMMCIIAIIFGFLMTITSYVSAALLHPIGGWVAVCTAAMTMLFSIIGIMTGAKFGTMSISQHQCGNWFCYDTIAHHDLLGDKLLAPFYLSQILIVVASVQCYVAMCLLIIGSFVAKKSEGDGGSLGEKLT